MVPKDKRKRKNGVSLMDEVYRKQLVNYVDVKFYGTKNGQFTKILLSEKDDGGKWTRVNQENGIQIKLKIASSSSNE